MKTILALILAGAQLYGAAGIVTEIQPIEDYQLVTVETRSGDVWQFYGEGFEVGSVERLVMDSKNTPEIEDDEIVWVMPK